MTIGKIPRNQLCSQLLESSFRRVARKLGKNVSGLENRTQRVPKRSYQSLVGWNPFQPLFMFGQQFFENEKDKGRVRDYQFQSIVSAIEAGPFCRLKLFLFFVNFWLSFFWLMASHPGSSFCSSSVLLSFITWVNIRTEREKYLVPTVEEPFHNKLRDNLFKNVSLLRETLYHYHLT